MNALAATIAVLSAALPQDAAASPAWHGPGFVDAFDEVRVWLPAAVTPEELRGKVRVRVGSRDIAIRAIRGGEPAAPKRDPGTVVLAGTLQTVLGGREWDPAGSAGRMTPLGNDVYELVTKLPPGRYEYKVARGGSWEENYGEGFVANGPNRVLVLPTARIVRFVVDFASHTLRDSVTEPDAVKAPRTVPVQPAGEERVRHGRFQSVRVQLATALTPADLARPLSVRVGDAPWRPLYAREVLSAPAFYYAPSDLGSRWTPTRTTFKVWSPVAQQVNLLLFPSASASAARRVPMRRGPAGVWSAVVPGDRHGTFYQYEFASYGKKHLAADVNAFAASADSSRSVVVNLARTDPPGWPTPPPFWGRKPTDAVLYELHVRDFSIDPASGVRPEWRGKYLAFTQMGTAVPGTTFATGSDYLKNLGITHVHLLPMEDFNPAHARGYNWGYETTLFNIPEEQYSVRPADPLARLRETKQMVQALHRLGIGVVMDVVYNHSVPSEGDGSPFWASVPYYYFRTNDRGEVLNESGVGNALHDEHPMVRKYIRDSLRFWAREYRMDGFRFDLLGMFTPATVRDLSRAIRAVNPSAVIYGEPWTGGGPLRFGKGDQRGSAVAVFNDHFRNLFRGDLDGSSAGFVAGGATDRGAVERAIAGSIDDFTDSPEETINYLSAHDNLTLWDRIGKSLPGADEATKRAAVKLAFASVLLSQGVPFLEGGVEIGRTKGGNNNSYDAGDAVNRYDWQRAPRFTEVRDYARGLIALRRAHPAFRLATRAQVKAALHFLPASQLPAQTVAFRLEGHRVGDPWREILVILQNSRQSRTVTLPGGPWSVAVDSDRAGTAALRSVQGRLTLPPLSATVLFRK